jgi:hypothetical protein
LGSGSDQLACLHDVLAWLGPLPICDEPDIENFPTTSHATIYREYQDKQLPMEHVVPPIKVWLDCCILLE